MSIKLDAPRTVATNPVGPSFAAAQGNTTVAVADCAAASIVLLLPSIRERWGGVGLTPPALAVVVFPSARDRCGGVGRDIEDEAACAPANAALRPSARDGCGGVGPTPGCSTSAERSDATGADAAGTDAAGTDAAAGGSRIEEPVRALELVVAAEPANGRGAGMDRRAAAATAVFAEANEPEAMALTALATLAAVILPPSTPTPDSDSGLLYCLLPLRPRLPPLAAIADGALASAARRFLVPPASCPGAWRDDVSPLEAEAEAEAAPEAEAAVAAAAAAVPAPAPEAAPAPAPAPTAAVRASAASLSAPAFELFASALAFVPSPSSMLSVRFRVSPSPEGPAPRRLPPACDDGASSLLTLTHRAKPSRSSSSFKSCNNKGKIRAKSDRDALGAIRTRAWQPRSRFAGASTDYDEVSRQAEFF